MAQPFKDFLTALAADPALQERWLQEPKNFGREMGLTDEQIAIAVEGELREIQKELNREAKADPDSPNPGIARPLVIIDN